LNINCCLISIITHNVTVVVDPEDKDKGKVAELIEENNIWNGTVTVVVQSPGWDIRPGGGGESDGKTIRGLG